MKYLKIIAPVLILLITSCSAQNKSNNFDAINYEAQTRGSMVKINVEDGKVHYKTYDSEETYELSQDQLGKLNDLVSEINLNEIKDLKTPSKNSATDRALIAKVSFKVKDKEYTSSTFDAGNPPKELKKLENLLFLLAKLKE
ncbi:hypothetical protein H3Z83_11190 [Tenacibaculum sp. S7007]|uniref:Lipoprotein n=1 Tax=Tenacibaculum pelagium TaxID=2759527 RepID=A0A839ARW8_9FLAO|nr:hypothetical protein [Tenacibaculum pelagium]MBA6157078.1 hypothetical protein [Tenacibaculum pelagium]